MLILLSLYFQGSTILAVCAYRDISGLFTTVVTEVAEKPPEKIPKTPTDANPFHLDKTSVNNNKSFETHLEIVSLMTIVYNFRRSICYLQKLQFIRYKIIGSNFYFKTV